jgi:hypothetical protein
MINRFILNDVKSNMNVKNCNRCSGETKGKTILSIFNEQVICLECKETEKKHPKYDSAVQAEYEQVKKGNYNFEGIGLPDDYDNFMKSIKQKI